MAERLQIEISGDARKLITALQQSGVELDQFSRKGKTGLGDMAAAMTKFGIAASAVVGVGKLALDLAQTGAESIKVARTFENLSGSAADAAANMAAMQAATRGLISTTEQQQIANQLLGMNIATNAEELEKVVSVSRRLGSEFRGLGAREAAEEFALMISNMSVARLDSFGIASGQVRQRIDELMEATAGMTREEAFFQATMEAAEETLGRLGPEIETTEESLSRLNAEWGNFVSAVGESIEQTGLLEVAINDLAEILRAVKVEIGVGGIDEGIENVNAKLEAMRGRLQKLQEGSSFAQWMNRGEIADLTDEIAALEDELAALHREQQIAVGTSRELDNAFQDFAETIPVIADGIGRLVRVGFDSQAMFAGISNAASFIEGMQDDLADKRAGYELEAERRITRAKTAAIRAQEREQEDAARAAENRWTEAFNRVKGAVSSVVGSGLGVLGDLGLDFLGDDSGRAIGENARRLAAIAVGDFNGEAAQLFAQERPELFKKIMESEDPAAAAQEMLRQFQFGIGASDLLDKEAAKSRIKQILLGTAETDALIAEITQELMGEGFGLAQIQSAIGESGLGGGGQEAAMQTAKTQFGAMEEGLVVAAKESNVIAKLIGVMGESAAQADYSKIADPMAKGIIDAIALSDSWGALVDKVIEGLIGRGLLNNPATGRGPV